MTAKGDRAASGVQVISYIVICEVIMQVCLLCKNTSHTLPLISAVYCMFSFSSKVYLQSEGSGSHRRKFQHRMPGLLWQPHPHPTFCRLLCDVQTQSSPSSGRTTLRVCSGSALLCHIEKFLPSEILLSFISLWLTPLCVCILLDEFSGMRVHLYDFSFIWPLCFLKMAIFSHNTQGILICTKQLVLSGMWTGGKTAPEDTVLATLRPWAFRGKFPQNDDTS